MSEKPKESKPKRAGGFRPGAGRKYEGVPTKKIRITEYVRDKLIDHLSWLFLTSGQSISQQEYSSKAILKYALSSSKDSSLIQELAEEIAPSFAPWTTITITQEAYEELKKLVKKIEPFTPVHTSLSSVYTVIILEDIKTQKRLLSSIKSKLESST